VWRLVGRVLRPILTTTATRTPCWEKGRVVWLCAGEENVTPSSTRRWPTLCKCASSDHDWQPTTARLTSCSNTKVCVVGFSLKTGNVKTSPLHTNPKPNPNLNIILHLKLKPISLFSGFVGTFAWLTGKCQKIKGDVIAFNWSSLQSYRAPPAIWDHTVLLASWHKWTRRVITLAR